MAQQTGTVIPPLADLHLTNHTEEEIKGKEQP